MDIKRSSNGFCSISPKTQHYFSNGGGRDGYIATNSGGLIAPIENKTTFELGTFMKSIQYKEKSPRIDSKGVYYHSDGTGRDSYVVVSSGGLVKAANAGEYKSTFYQQLRQYENRNGSHPSSKNFLKMNRSISPKSKQDIYFQTMANFSKKHQHESKLISMYQHQMDKRLSKPKIKKALLKQPKK